MLHTNLKGHLAPLLKSIMNLEQLIFTWNGRQLVLTLFASLFLYESSFMSKKKLLEATLCFKLYLHIENIKIFTRNDKICHGIE